ncbi:MAG TPA: hypothetical protein VMR98_03650 [Candidatus Polarisedimenticolaceae bacterium]|nr:hypothetical protein [Candidatus Polarisedimenticolaceae bacterium]
MRFTQLFTAALTTEKVKWQIVDDAGTIDSDKTFCLQGENEGWLRYSRCYRDLDGVVALVFTFQQ